MKRRRTYFWEHDRDRLQRILDFGKLSYTADDHHYIGSTPPSELLDNPGKSKVETMSDADILDYLRQLSNDIEILSYDTQKTVSDISYLRLRKEELRQALRYLRHIDRLPSSFRDYI